MIDENLRKEMVRIFKSPKLVNVAIDVFAGLSFAQAIEKNKISHVWVYKNKEKIQEMLTFLEKKQLEAENGDEVGWDWVIGFCKERLKNPNLEDAIAVKYLDVLTKALEKKKKLPDEFIEEV
ncbi:MAG: hypothetical protein ABDH28_00035 [Brevinematia bacterium]